MSFIILGIGDPLPISAASRLGIGDMLEEVVKHFPASAQEEEEDSRPKVAIIGKPNVGKSSLVNKLAGEAVLSYLISQGQPVMPLIQK